MYEYRSKDLDGIFLTGYGKDIFDTYEGYKSYHLNPKSTKYGAVLVRTKRIIVGYEIKVRFYFRNNWYWKPHFSWRYSKYFHWLFFMIWLDTEHNDIFDEVVKDHLSEFQAGRQGI